MGRWSPEVGVAHAVIPSLFEVYDADLVPLVFEGYADDLVARTVAAAPGAVLEVAAGTGVVTRRLAAALPADLPITATDLVPGMLERARAVCAGTPLRDEILQRGDAALDVTIHETARRLADRFGSVEPEGAMSAFLVTVAR